MLNFSGIVPAAVSAPVVVLSNGGTTATLTFQLTPPATGWESGVGTVTIAAGAFEDAAGNGSGAASADFVFEPNLAQLERGVVVRAINVGTTDQAPGALGGGPAGRRYVVDNNRYGGALTDTIITDAFGNPVAFEADNDAFYTSPKTNGQLNANVDGQSTGQGSGSNAGDVDLDGSAYHTYRDSTAATWTGTYDGFANGTYIVELHFAELFWNAAGDRVGDFTVNGVLIDETGRPRRRSQAVGNDDTPYVVRVPVTVTDGTVTVEVSSSAGQAGYSAIVVYEAVNPSVAPQPVDRRRDRRRGRSGRDHDPAVGQPDRRDHGGRGADAQWHGGGRGCGRAVGHQRHLRGGRGQQDDHPARSSTTKTKRAPRRCRSPCRTRPAPPRWPMPSPP